VLTSSARAAGTVGTPLSDAIAATLAWYRNHGNAPSWWF
jgi:hypothetical protein